MEEMAMGLLLAKVPGMEPDQALAMLENGLKKYAEAAITTAQEGAGLPPMLKLLEAGDKAGVLPIDVVSYPVDLTANDATIEQVAETWKTPELNFAANHGLVPSFFPIHVTFWGDRHRDIFPGAERAARISPSRSALDLGMKITLHHDAPVAGCDMLGVVSAAVNRLTTSGKRLGPEQAIAPYEAFRAITKDAAWQYFEEHRKGTIEAGKLADLVILAEDPFSIDQKRIGDIPVMETIKDGQNRLRTKPDKSESQRWLVSLPHNDP